MTLSWWQGLVLGLVQGLTEFLPISSSGHLVLAERFVGFKPQGVFFEVVVHLGTLISVFIAYRGRIVELIKGMFGAEKSAWQYAWLIIIASVPAALAGFLLRDWFEAKFHSPIDLGWQFIVNALILWSTKWAAERLGEGKPIDTGRALLVGIGQAFAILPAISRSGTTIAAALWTGVKPAVAAEFSFLMSIVVIAGTGVLEVRTVPPGVDPFEPGMIWAFVASLVSGIVAIRFLVALLRSSKFHLFAPYCAVVGVLCLIWFGLLGR